MLCKENIKMTEEYKATLQDALKVLGKKNFALILQGVSFPAEADENTGFGTYNSKCAKKLMDFAKGLFTGIQLGPNGKTKLSDPSPYTGTVFSENPLFINLKDLTTKEFDNLLSVETFEKIVNGNDTKDEFRANYEYAYGAYEVAFEEIWTNYKKNFFSKFKLPFEMFKKENAYWLDNDALYEAFCLENECDYWPQWKNELDKNIFKIKTSVAKNRLKEVSKKHADVIEKYKFIQFIVSRQSEETRKYAKSAGLKLIADRQVAFSDRDSWAYQDLFLEGYSLGCPPDYFSEDGQAWGFPVVDPDKMFDEKGNLKDAGKLLKRLYLKMFKENPGGIRIDHTVGLIDPWVYEADKLPKPEEGAGRLYSSPTHPVLKKYSIATEADVDPEVSPDKEKWVTKLSDEQVSRYGMMIEKIVIAAAKEAGLDKDAIVAEDLGTLTFPVEAVMKKYALQGMKLVQFVVAEEEDHPYRCKNITPKSWAMVGTHDNEPIRMWAEKMVQDEEVKLHVNNLMEDLYQNGGFDNPYEFESKLYNDPKFLAFTKLVEIFASSAENIQIFFTDFFGINEVYNKPGTSGPENWSLRLPSNFEELYAKNLESGDALNLPLALSFAIRARGREFTMAHQELLNRLGLLI